MNAVMYINVYFIYCNTQTSSSVCPELWMVSLKYWHVNLINRIRTVQGLRVYVCVSALGIATGLLKQRQEAKGSATDSRWTQVSGLLCSCSDFFAPQPQVFFC